MIVVAAALALVAGCATAVEGHGTRDPLGMAVRGDSGGSFDTEVKAALADVISFWRLTYPKVANGAPLPPLRGSLYSVDGANLMATRQVPASAKPNKCLRQRLTFIVDNAAYCQLDDSIIWDRGQGH